MKRLYSSFCKTSSTIMGIRKSGHSKTLQHEGNVHEVVAHGHAAIENNGQFVFFTEFHNCNPYRIKLKWANEYKVHVKMAFRNCYVPLSTMK